jgi:two-component sensor histidine kinase
MTLTARLYLLVFLAVSPAITLLFYNDWNDRRGRQSEAEAQAVRYARLVSGEMDRLFEGIRAQLSAIAEAPVVQSFQDPDCGQYLMRLEGSNAATTSVSVYDVKGDRLCSDVARVNIADRSYFGQALQSEDLVVGEYVLGKTSTLPVLPFAMRIKREGQVIGVIVTTLRLDWLRQHLSGKSADFPPRSSITVIDRAGTILVRLPNREREGTKLARYPQLLTSQQGGTLHSTADNTADGVARLLGYTSVHEPPLGVGVAVGLPMDVVLAGLNEARTRNLLLLGIAALLAFTAAHFGGRRFILRPVSGMLEVTERLRKGDLSARVGVTAPRSELGRLGSAINAMAGDLEGSLKHKDMLLRELSHRVMNSLQTIGSLFTLQARAVRDPEARRQFDQAVTRINSVALAYRRLHAADGVEVVEFSTLLRDLCSDLQTSMLPDGSPIAVEADPILLSPEQAMPLALVVNELVTNAIKHGGQEPAIIVKLGRSSEGCRLAVRNRGDLPPNYNPAATKGFGMRMVRSTVAQLSGHLEAASMGGETEYAVTFKPSVPQPTLFTVVNGEQALPRSV